MSPGIWKWADRLGDVPSETSRVTLGEGRAPRNLARGRDDYRGEAGLVVVP